MYHLRYACGHDVAWPKPPPGHIRAEATSSHCPDCARPSDAEQAEFARWRVTYRNDGRPERTANIPTRERAVQTAALLKAQGATAVRVYPITPEKKES